MSGLVLLVAMHSAVALLWLAWRWNRPLVRPAKRKSRRL